MHMTQEAVAEKIGVSWMTVHRLTIEAGDLDPPDMRSEAARRIYHWVANAPTKYHSMLERVMVELLEGLESSEGTGKNRR